MLINLTNHPVESWSESQRVAAEKQFGEIIDVPFPQIEPDAELNEVIELVADYLKKCVDMLGKIPKVGNSFGKENAIHIMGEMTFVYHFVQKISELGIVCLAATSRRIVEEEKNGTKVSRFEFVRFRAYTDELF